MARRRGLGNADRVGCDIVTITSTASVAIIANPCFVYSIDISLSNTNATGQLFLADTSAAADVRKEAERFDATLGVGGASAMADRIQRNFFPPLYFARGMYWTQANDRANISVSYLLVS